MRLILLLLCLACPLSAAAQQGDPMDVQRCIWRCLAASSGPASSEYNQCVVRLCSGDPVASPSPAVPPPAPLAWRAGLASDGVHRFAGADAEQGYGFYYFCTPQASFFALTALPMAAGQYRFVIGDVAYLVPLDRSRGDLSVNIPPGDTFMQGVQAGSWLRVEALDGTSLIQFSLSGAGESTRSAVEGCFGR
ncbi:hypothetical protein FIU94_13450 [Sulfitobacter sp. THAF37]|uniref:hypothetical protein n=1 Tax=Sulfitobacter sp. THAF37 TaxID=2587855 RepID=UPI0012690838|nr:hypothetical protein [Sulfitobacter sp. THAF37]QFT59833.1 hypothetical protein FIU94_13450 [Sulfitobacter sp. THAF37]